MKKVIVFGGSTGFIRFLEECVGKEAVTQCRQIQEISGGETVFLLPAYDAGQHSMKEFSDEEFFHVRSLLQENTKVYIENYPAYDYRDCFLFGLQALGYEQRIRNESLKVYGQPFEILQKRGGYFFPNHLRDKECVPFLEIKELVGSHRILLEKEIPSGYALVKKGALVTCAMLDITDFDPKFALPNMHWKKIFGVIFSELLEIAPHLVEEAFERCFPKISTAEHSGETETLRESIRQAVEWHLRSGILPQKDGSGRIYEMIRSFDLEPAKNFRGDAGMFTAALFAFAAKEYNEPAWREVADRIFQKQFTECRLQITEGANQGLFRWFTDGEDNSFLYASDCARVANSILGYCQATGRKDLYECVLSAGEAFLRWFRGNALMPVPSFDFSKKDLDSIQQEATLCDAPEYYEPVMIFLWNLYRLTGEERYQKQIEKTATVFAQKTEYPTMTAHSQNFTKGRLLGIFAVAQQFGDGIWTEKLNELLDYFENLQTQEGGISEGGAYIDADSLLKPKEFSVAFGGENDQITDIMYCCNTVLTALYILQKTTYREQCNLSQAEKIFSKLAVFLQRIQIRSDDPRLDGAWMRAYDMELGEYFGCDKDFAWGPYSILTGWMTGAIPLVFLGMLGAETIY